LTAMSSSINIEWYKKMVKNINFGGINKQSCHILRCGKWEDDNKISVKIASATAEIMTRHVLSISRICYHLS
jgi:hypothetical protein